MVKTRTVYHIAPPDKRFEVVYEKFSKKFIISQTFSLFACKFFLVVRATLLHLVLVSPRFSPFVVADDSTVLVNVNPRKIIAENTKL